MRYINPRFTCLLISVCVCLYICLCVCLVLTVS